ncbi:hypothetical protein Shyhy01_14740 [Streptomyces hygroscopicus subsp. hygroscopicus]|nr:hypothetical protein Shyhy01_14740 [Streptomyces hygroscopicus subsp. hygroscopicus]
MEPSNNFAKRVTPRAYRCVLTGGVLRRYGGVATVEMTDDLPRYTMGNGAGTGSRHEQYLRAVGTSSKNRPSDR